MKMEKMKNSQHAVDFIHRIDAEFDMLNLINPGGTGTKASIT